MNKIVVITTVLLVVVMGLTGLATADSTGENHTDMDMLSHGQADSTQKNSDKMDMQTHDDMDMSNPKSNFQHSMTEKHVRADFQIMSLADMNMKDQDGNTHHVMVKLFDAQKHDQLQKAVGKVKIIGPDKSEQTATLKSYNGLFAANFKFEQTGKYGVICLLKVNDETHLFKFWYPNG
jgi:hypothetical protein